MASLLIHALPTDWVLRSYADEFKAISSKELTQVNMPGMVDYSKYLVIITSSPDEGDSLYKYT